MKKPIESLILTLRGQKVILDADLAEIYGVPTRSLNQAMKRNIDRFPEDFVFQLTDEEVEGLKSQSVTANESYDGALRSQFVILKKGRGKHRKYPPYAFTEHGAIMAATILNSAEAVTMSVYVVRAFIQMRERIAENIEVLKRLAEIDRTLLKHDKSLQIIWTQLQPLLAPPPAPQRPRIGFHPEKS